MFTNALEGRVIEVDYNECTEMYVWITGLIGRDQYSLCVMDVFLKSCMYTNQILFQALQESLFKGTYGKSFRRELAIT